MKDPLTVDQSFFASLARGDVNALNELMTDDFLMVDVFTGSEVTKEMFLGAMQDGQLQFEVVDVVESRVRRYGTAAIVNGRTLMTGRFGVHTFEVKSRYTHTFVQQGDVWKMAAAQGTPITEPTGSSL